MGCKTQSYRCSLTSSNLKHHTASMESLLATPTSSKSPLLVTLLLPACLVCVLVPIILLRRSSRLKLLPPGPRGLPFIGHLHLLGTSPHQALCQLSKTYGPLMLLQLGSVPVVVASTPTAARQILQAHDKTFSFREQTAAATLILKSEDMLFSQPGPYWKLTRQICLTDLFGSKRLESFRPLITEEMHALCRSILHQANELVPVRDELYAATSNIISRMCMGKRLADLAPRCSRADPSYSLVTLLAEAAQLIGVFNVGDFMPYLAWMDVQGCERKSKVIGQKLHTFSQEIIDERRQMRRRKNGIPSEQDFLDVLMNASKGRPDVPMEDHNIRAILLNMFGAGIDTSSISTEWALCELIANPIKMKRLQAELECVVGTSQLVQETNLPHLPYLHAVVKETMRLHPVLPLLVPHKASQQCNIFGYDIPAGTLAYVNTWAIGRDPLVWERPLEFMPERFLECDTDVRGQHFELLPFGSGRRACPGWALGLSNVQYMLASIVHCFDWSMAEELTMSEKFGLVLTLKNPLIAKATPRLPMHLFK